MKILADIIGGHNGWGSISILGGLWLIIAMKHGGFLWLRGYIVYVGKSKYNTGAFMGHLCYTFLTPSFSLYEAFFHPFLFV